MQAIVPLVLYVGPECYVLTMGSLLMMTDIRIHCVFTSYRTRERWNGVSIDRCVRRKVSGRHVVPKTAAIPPW